MLYSCSDVAGGATTESTNGAIQVSLDIKKDSTIVQSSVWIRPSSYLPDTSGVVIESDATIGKDGVFILDSLPNDSLVLVIENKDKAIKIDIESDGESTDSISDIELLEQSELSGRIIRDSIDLNAAVYVRFFGSEKMVKTDAGGYFTIDMPVGEWSFHISTSDDNSGTTTVPSVVVTEGVATYLGMFHLPINVDNLRLTVEGLLSSNNVESISFDDVATIVDNRIDTLNLSGLGIFSIPGSIGYLQMNRIDLSNNSLDNSDLNNNLCSQVHEIDLSGNQITAIPASFRDYTNLRLLDISDNEITTIDPAVLLISPDTLWVAGNKLSSVTTEVASWLDEYAEDNWRDLQQ